MVRTIIMQAKGVGEERVVCNNTSLLIGHLKVYHMEVEAEQEAAEAGGGVDVGEEGAFGSFERILHPTNT